MSAPSAVAAHAALAVPFADLPAQYRSIQSEVDAAMAEVIRTAAFIRGPFVEKIGRAHV